MALYFKFFRQATGLILALSMAGTVASSELEKVIVDWERKLNARIGVLLLDVETDWRIAYRASERFPMSSTFKVLLCGAVLSRVDAKADDLAHHISYHSEDLVTYSPITKKHLSKGMTVADLCEATITYSDNTAANLLLSRIGGPAGLTGFLRQIGDTTTRSDRWETELNEAVPGDLRDTTSPYAIVSTLKELLFGDSLKLNSAKQLQRWMIDDKVADSLIRAHLPEGWEIGDKTGAGGFGSRAIVAFLRTSDEGLYLAAIYLTETEAEFSTRNQVVADIGKAIVSQIQKHRKFSSE